MALRKVPRVKECLLVMSKGKSVTFRRRESLDGYSARYGGGDSVACAPVGAGGVGGMVVCGFGEVRA